MNIYHLQCNDLTHPIGLDSTPLFSWRCQDDQLDQTQTAYRLVVSSNEKNLKKQIYDVWDTGKKLSSKNHQIKYQGPALYPRNQYFWKVWVWDKKNNCFESAHAFFQTGKLDEKWQANWIGAEYIKNEESGYIAPYMRKTFTLDKQVKSAVIHICGLGYFEGYLNGEKISDHVLSTAFTQFDKRVLYLTYDVSTHLHMGKNALGVILGNGWYHCFSKDPWNTRQAPWRHFPKLLAELHVTFSDQTSMVIKSDPTWKSIKSPITFNGIRNGEFYDARLETPHWNDAHLDDSKWQSTKILRSPGGQIKAFEHEPIRMIQQRSCIKKWKTPQGRWIFDTGQNLSGVGKITVKGPIGTKITLRYSDMLNQDTTLDQAPISGFVKSGDFQTDQYIKKSNDVETWHPIFVYHGFQYIEVDGLDYEPALEDVKALVIHTDLEENGFFECCDPHLNTVMKLAKWATLSNFHGIPTDDPHREKNAWTGDVSLSAEQMLINFSSVATLRKWMYDLIDAQRPDGAIPCVVPSTGWGYNWGNGPDWSSALTDIPWYMYLYWQDMAIVQNLYDSIKKHCDFMGSMADGYIVHYGIGDWCPPFDGPAISVNMSSFKCPTALTDTAYYYNAAQTLAKMARLLNKPQDQIHFDELASNIKKAFRKTFFDKENRKIQGNCQTSTGCMLYFGLYEKDEEMDLVNLLLQQIKDKKNHLDFGILGNKFVMNTLGKYEHVKTAIGMIINDSYPSFKHWIDQGATTLWECWNGGGSHNHHMFSDVAAFMYKYIAGIRVDEDRGFGHIHLQPAVDCGLTYAKAHIGCSYGKICCEWKHEKNAIFIEIIMPPGTQASLQLPKKYHQQVCARPTGIVSLGSGHHTLTLRK